MALGSDGAGTGADKGRTETLHVGAPVKEGSASGISATEVVEGLTRVFPAIESDMSKFVERIVDSRSCVTRDELYVRFADRCLGSARYGLLGATGGRPPTEARDCISDAHAKIGSTTPAFDVALAYVSTELCRGAVLAVSRSNASLSEI